jgi:L-asparaginase
VGNLASALFDALEETRAAGIPVVITTRVHTGRTLPLYAGRGSGISLREIGCLFADNLPPHKARVLLIAGLMAGHRGEALAALFAR